MNKIKIFLLIFAILSTATTAEAQVSKGKNKSSKKDKTEKTIKVKKDEEKTDTASIAINPIRSIHKSISDPLVVRYFRGGHVMDGKLYLIPNRDYDSLPFEHRIKVMNNVSKEFPNVDIEIQTSQQQRELWISVDGDLRRVERWNNDSLNMAEYLPLELKRNGYRKMYYYLGGMFGGGKEYGNGSFNLRCGTYLFERIIDASVSLNLGYTKSADTTLFAGDMGLASRVYLPIKINKVNISPYAGAGISWAFAPVSFFELQMLAGGCWFINSYSIDAGLQYGTQSGLSFTVGISFRPKIRKK